MQTIERAERLLDTQTAGLGVFLAVVLLAGTVLIVLLLACTIRLRPVTGALILCTAALFSAGIVHVTYEAWYRHRCVDHSSDIRECVENQASRS